MRGWVVPQFTHPSMNGDDVIVAGDNIQRCDLVVLTFREDGMGEHWDTVSTPVVIRSGQADDVEPASADAARLFLAVAPSGGDNGAARGSIVVGSLSGRVSWRCGRWDMGSVHRACWRRGSGLCGGSLARGGVCPCSSSTVFSGETIVTNTNCVS